MKAVIYARYSSDNQREESIEGQIRECTDFAVKKGITVLRHYIDRAFSAKTDNRPEFQNMIKDSEKHLFDVIIVWKLDRFARNRYDSARYKAKLKKNGVKVVSATEVISEGAEGIILESVLEGYAEYYSADLAEKVIRRMTENALKCKYTGGILPIGYVLDDERHFQIDPLTAPFVLKAFKLYDEGATMKEVRDSLNENGLKSKRGHSLTFNSIQYMLNNRRYIGEYRYRDIVIPGGVPAIVPQDLFDRVQEKMAKNKKAPARHKAEDDYLLTTKLFCGHCGAYLRGESGTSHTLKVHHYYKCANAKKYKTCKKKTVKKQWIEDLVVNETMKMVMDDNAIEAIVAMVMDLQEKESTDLPFYEHQLNETKKSIENMLNAIQQGILTKSTKSRLEELEAAQEDLEIKIANEKLIKPKVSEEFVTFWLHRFRDLDVRQQSHRKMLIDTFVNAIYLYDDKTVLTFNYKDGTKTVSINEINAVLAKKEKSSDLDCFGALVEGKAMWSFGKKQNNKIIIAAGEYGEVFWNIDSERTLTVWGNGDIPDCMQGLPPWYPYVTGGDAGDPYAIKKIIVKKGIKSIGSNAFNGLIHAEKVEIPDGVSEIGDYAFHECKRIEKIDIPATVTYIGLNCFEECSSLKEINVHPDNPEYKSKNGVLFYRYGVVLVRYPSCNLDWVYITPLGVGVIGESAFSFVWNLTAVRISEGVRIIGSNAFEECRSLKVVEICDGLEEICDSAFFYCDLLEEICIPKSLIKIEADAFSQCKSLKHVYYGGTKEDWEKISIGSANEPLLNAEIHFES